VLHLLHLLHPEAVKQAKRKVKQKTMDYRFKLEKYKNPSSMIAMYPSLGLLVDYLDAELCDEEKTDHEETSLIRSP